MQVAESIARSVRQWIAGQADLRRLTPANWREQLDKLGPRVLFSAPTVAREIEMAVLERVARGLMTEAEQQQRINDLEIEKQIYRDEYARRERERMPVDPDVSLSDATIDAAHNTWATAKLEFRPNGTVLKEINGVSMSLPTDWLRQKAASWKAWTIRAQLAGGATPTGSPLDQWLPLTGALSWQLSRKEAGKVHSELAVSLSNNYGTTIAAAATYTLTAEVRT
jgi:hypothetical protein